MAIGRIRNILVNIPGRAAPASLAAKPKDEPRIRKEGAMRGFIACSLKIGGELVKFELNHRLIIQALIDGGQKQKAAEHCLELVLHGVGFSAEARQELLAQGRELAAQAGKLDSLLPVIDQLAAKIAEPAARAVFLQKEGELFVQQQAYIGAAELYEKAADLLEPEQAQAMAPKLAALYERIGDQLAQTTDEKPAAKTAYQAALELWPTSDHKLQIRDCQLKAAELAVQLDQKDEAVKLYSAAARLTLEAGLAREEGEQIIRRAIALAPTERQMAIWQKYEQAADQLAPTHAPTIPPPEIESAREKEAVAARLRKTIMDIRSLIGNKLYHQAFNELLAAGNAAEKERGLIVSDRPATRLLAELWQLCGEQGLITLEKKRSVKPELVVSAFLRAQELWNSLGQKGEAYGLNEKIEYTRRLGRSRS